MGGAIAEASTDGSGVAQFQAAPVGPFTVTISYMGVSYTFTGSLPIDSSFVVTIALSYPVAASFGLFVFFASSLYISKRRKGQKAYRGYGSR
jgi:hypothetical protein